MSRLLAAARRLAAHPTWAVEYARMARDRRQPAPHFSLSEQHGHLVDGREALAGPLGITASQFDGLRSRLWMPEPIERDHTAWRSRTPLLDLLGVTVRVLRPDVVVETGVERGFSSAVMLDAMEQNGTGRLHSVDLPPLGVDSRTFTGQVVPDRLRHRWELTVGPSRVKLPGLLERLGTIDLFLHDADHTHASQLDEFRTAWPVLRPGGLLICDDVWNSSLGDFCGEVGAEPVLVRRWDDTDGIGLVRKPG